MTSSLRRIDVAGRDLPALAQAMCSRHEGIGADGLMITRSDPGGAHAPVQPDGSPSRSPETASVPGSARRARTWRVTRRDRHAGGQKVLELREQDGDTLTFRAAMGIPQDIRPIEIQAAGEKVQAVALSVGNPQCVLLDDPLVESRLYKLGPAIEHHPKFPDRTNVSFARVEAPNRVRILIWERGVGPTKASGTGACGAAVAAASYGGASRDVESSPLAQSERRVAR